MTAIVAHAADWLASLAFLAPVLLIGAWLGISSGRERGRSGDEGSEPRGLSEPGAP